MRTLEKGNKLKSLSKYKFNQAETARMALSNQVKNISKIVAKLS